MELGSEATGIMPSVKVVLSLDSQPATVPPSGFVDGEKAAARAGVAYGHPNHEIRIRKGVKFGEEASMVSPPRKHQRSVEEFCGFRSGVLLLLVAWNEILWIHVLTWARSNYRLYFPRPPGLRFSQWSRAHISDC